MASPQRARHPGPPDGGWGWMIVAGCFLVTICTRAVTRCISIFFVEFQAYFGQDYARTAWIHSIVDCATMLCAPLGSLISNHVSCQVGIMLGGLLASAGLILSSFATSLEHLYLSLGVLTGLGFALCYSPAIAMVGKYFNKRKALAYGIAMSGMGIWYLHPAPVVQLLIEPVFLAWSLLILGGFVFFKPLVCGALMRPMLLRRTVKTAPEFLEQDYVPKAQKRDLKRMSVCSPLITWSHECLCYCSWKEYDFLLMPGFMVLAVSVLFMAYGCSPLFVYLVPYALSVGVSHHQAAFLMSILGVIDIIGNITFGWLTDRRCLKKHRRFCYLFAVGMDGLCCLFLPILQNFPLLVPFSFTFGYFDGAYVTLIPVVTADVVGTSSLSSALGVVYFLHAIPYLVRPVAGWLVDTTGSYTASSLCGFSMIFSLLLCFARLAKKIQRTHLWSLTSDTGTNQHIWTNGAISYSVHSRIDQKDVELAADTNSYSHR
ncbi:LOW QUALITY PROTEIN: monocarboxylate transporter 12 [Alca torda]